MRLYWSSREIAIVHDLVGVDKLAARTAVGKEALQYLQAMKLLWER